MFEDVIGAMLAGNGIGVAMWVWLTAKFKELEAPLKKLGQLVEQVTQLDKDVAILRRDMDSMAHGKAQKTGAVPVVMVPIPTPFEGMPLG